MASIDISVFYRIVAENVAELASKILEIQAKAEGHKSGYTRFCALFSYGDIHASVTL